MRSDENLIHAILLQNCRIELRDADHLSRVWVAVSAIYKKLFIEFLLVLTTPSKHNEYNK